MASTGSEEEEQDQFLTQWNQKKSCKETMLYHVSLHGKEPIIFFTSIRRCTKLFDPRPIISKFKHRIM